MLEKELKTFGKFVSFGSRPNAETFRELPDCLVWTRFVLAISYGIFYLGSTASDNQRGATPMLMALNFVSFAPMVYCMIVLQADSDSYGGKLLFSGLFNSMALVLLIWIYYYTLHHEEEEQKLTSLLADIAAKVITDDDGATDGDEGAYVPPVVDEPEF